MECIVKRIVLSVALMPMLFGAFVGCKHTMGDGVVETNVNQERADNPFFAKWTTPFELPPFDLIKEEHFLPAIQAGIDAQKKEVLAIADCKDAATFDNTIVALDLTGSLLEKVLLVFYNLQSAETTPGIQAIAREVAPLTAALRDDIYLNPKLFERVSAVYEARASLGLQPVDLRLIEETYKSFVRAGAKLNEDSQRRLREINLKLASLGVHFGDNLLAETNAFGLLLESKDDLAGLDASTVATAAQDAAKAGHQGKWLVTLSYPSMWPFVQQSTKPELRRKVIEAYAKRCDNGNQHDNNEIVAQIVKLRIEKAQLLGFKSWVDFVLDDRMAKTGTNVMDLLNQVWEPAIAVAQKEAAEYLALARKDGLKGDLNPWDWHYYAEKVRKEEFGIDTSELRQYFQLDNVLKGAFELANRLYGLTFTPVYDLKLYHPDVLAWEVKDQDGSHLGLFLGDYHPRPGKRVGAWSSRYKAQRVVDGKDVRPIVVNVGNFTRPTDDTPALLSLDETETLFHELGHGIHSLVARVPYSSLSGVPRDFVELPSQVNENWVLEPEMLAIYAKHYKTGEPMPIELVEKVQAASKHNQGFATVEYLAAAFLDMIWHELTEATTLSTAEFEKAALEKIGLISEILPRYRSTYFNHIFGGSGSYSAGYYSYMWSEVLDADAFAAFQETGDIFNKDVATRFRKEILELGGTKDSAEMYQNFRGRAPEVRPLLERRGLIISD